jgi:hypothetical protein
VIHTSLFDRRMAQMAPHEDVHQTHQVTSDVEPTLIRSAMEDILLSTPFCTSKQCQDMFRYGSDIAKGDLINSPAILIGAFNNSWTLNITHQLRFVFKEGDHIEDTRGKTRNWPIVIGPNGDIQDDYAVITRLLDAKTGQVVISAAGIGDLGTEAAVDFLTSPREMEELGQSAPTGWQKMNMQVVLHVKVLNQAFDKENILATEFW